jgi:hypothetical protein
VLEHAFGCIAAYARQDPAATEVITEGAKHMLREYARLEPGEISRVVKPEAWAAGALHAAFLLGSTMARSANQLAKPFGVSSSVVNVRSRRLREAVEWTGETPSTEWPGRCRSGRRRRSERNQRRNRRRRRISEGPKRSRIP